MADDLEAKIVKQLEYYFGDINLPKDKFMQSKIQEDDGWITLETLLTFKRLNSLSQDPEVIVSAVEKLKPDLIVVSEDRKKLRRNPELPVPEMNDERKKELISRSAYVKGFPKDEEFDSIMSFLEPYGPIESCQKRTNVDKITKNSYFKGSCFVIFKDQETCKKFIEAESIKYKDTELIRKWKADYFEEKKKLYEDRKNKKAGKVEEVEKEDESKKLPKGAILHFSGIGEEILTREDIKAKIVEIGEVGVSFVDFSRGDKEGYVRLPTENAAYDVVKKCEGTIKVEGADLTLRVLEGEEEEKYLKKTAAERKEKFSKGRKRKGKFHNEGGPKNKNVFKSVDVVSA